MSSMLGRSVLVFLWLFAAGLSGCSATSPSTSDARGTIMVHVRDDTGAPLANVRVAVTQPNDLGSFFTVSSNTDENGMRTFWLIRTGQRPVEVTPPSGYTVGAGGPIQTVNVSKNTTTTVTFILVRS